LDLSYPFLCRLISSSESSMTHLCHNVQHLSLRMIVGSMQLKVLALGVHSPEPLCTLELPEHRWRESGTICTGLLVLRSVLFLRFTWSSGVLFQSADLTFIFIGQCCFTCVIME
jgi:hypothetical protein